MRAVVRTLISDHVQGEQLGSCVLHCVAINAVLKVMHV